MTWLRLMDWWRVNHPALLDKEMEARITRDQVIEIELALLEQLRHSAERTLSPQTSKVITGRRDMTADLRHWVSINEIADDVRNALAEGDVSHAMRMLMDGLHRLKFAIAAGRLDEAVGQEPSSTGDIRWDTLIAASLRYILHSMNQPAPSWTLQKEPLEPFWWPVAYSASQEYVHMAHTPAELLRFNIFMDVKEFGQA